MVGRKDGKSAVLQAETGKLRLKVGGYEGGGKQGIVYDVTAQEEKKAHLTPARLRSLEPQRVQRVSKGF
jgi:hypothetical protein